MGFVSDEQYDCFVNHYDNYDWDELEEYDLAQYFVQLGWSNESWTGAAAEPESESKLWQALTEAEKTAAGMICFFQGIWDEEDLTTPMEVPIVYPDVRYQLWNALTADEQALATAAGWTEISWNSVGTAQVESLAFSSLTFDSQLAMTSLGLYEAQYDCYINHYNDYDWSELVLYDISPYFETLGWTEGSWNGTAAEPASEDKSWSELTAAEQGAAEELCFFQDMWDEVPLAQWGGSSARPLAFSGFALLVAIGASFFVM